jgi:hypothetical protein
VRRADNLTTFMFRSSRNFGNVSVLEPEGSVQAIRRFIFLSEARNVLFKVLTESSNMSVNSTLSRKKIQTYFFCSHVTKQRLNEIKFKIVIKPIRYALFLSPVLLFFH